MVTELNKIFLGNKPCQLWTKAQHFGNNHFLMMKVEMVSETLGFCPQLTWLVARVDFINK
jgi:hypothetical protein